MSRAAQAMRQLVGVIGTGALLLFFSEFFFFNEVPSGGLSSGSPAARLALLAEALAIYAFLSVPMLTALSWFRVQSWSGLFLAACLYGWAIEGVAIPVLYENVPWSFFWTSVSWHVLVDVFMGLVLLPRALASRHRWLAPLAAIALGLFWAYWITWTWADGARLSPDRFRGLVIWSFPLVPMGLALLAWSDGAALRLNRPVGLVLSLATLPLAVLMAVPTPLAGLVMAGLVLMVLALLHKEARWPSRALPLIVATPGRQWLWLALTPPAAILSYRVLHGTGIGGASDLVLPAFFVAGIAAFGTLVPWRLWRQIRLRPA